MSWPLIKCMGGAVAEQEDNPAEKISEEVAAMAIWTIGVDLGKKAKHYAVVLDEKGQRLNKELMFTTSADELENLPGIP